MKKCKDKENPADTGGAADVTKEDRPADFTPAPDTEEVKSEKSVVKRGIAMEAVDSPRFGGPGQAIATRGAAGGGSFSPSAQADRSPENPKVRGAGTDPMNKIDIRDEFTWNEVGAASFRTLIEGSPAGFSPDEVLGNFTYKDNLMFQLDNVGMMPGQFGKPYRRRIASISKDMLFFIAGQHDNAAKDAFLFYPTKTFSNSANRTPTDVEQPAVRSNYLMRGMMVTVARTNTSSAHRITKVTFDTVELPCTSSSNDLDVRQDNARVYWDLNNKLITQDYFDMVNKPENISANKYSPIPDGQPQALQHLLLAEDIANTDACIAFAAMRSAAEAYAYNRELRRDYGGGDGAKAQARAMLAPDCIKQVSSALEEYNVFSDNADAITSGYYRTSVDFHYTGGLRFTMPEYIMTFLDSPTKYNDSFGVWWVQPRGIRMLMEQAQKSFDEGNFLIDKDTYQLMDTMIGWHYSRDRRIGVSKFGLISPIDYNQLYKGTNEPTIQTSGMLESKYVMVDYTLAGSYYNHTELRSPLVDAILEVVRHRMLPKLAGHSGEDWTEMEIYIPFTFDCSKFTFGHAVLLEALPYVHEYIHNARAVFERFESQYGINPIKTELMQDLTLADVYKSSGYKGLGADANFPEASPFLKLAFGDPEMYNLSFTAWKHGIERLNGLVAVTFNDFGPISDSIDDPQAMLFPMMYPGMTLEQMDEIITLGAQKYLKSRDLPIHRYKLYDSANAFSRQKTDDVADTAATVNEDSNMPFFSFQKPQVYESDDVDNTALGLSLYDILTAPRVNGRMCPAPRGMLDFVMMSVSTSGLLPKASRAFKTDWTTANTHYYGWKVTPGASKVFTTSGTDKVIDFSFNDSTKKLEYRGYDIDNYRVNFIYSDPFVLTQLGNQLKRFMVHVTSGNLTDTQLKALATQYQMYLSPDQSMQFALMSGAAIGAPEDDSITIDSEATGYVSLAYTKAYIGTDTTHVYDIDPNGDNYIGDAASVTVTQGTLTHADEWKIVNDSTTDAITLHVSGSGVSISIGYKNPSLIMWTMDYLYPFVHSPFQGVAFGATAKNEVYQDDNLDLGLMGMFGMAGLQKVFYDRMNLRVYADKQEAGGRIYDNKFLHENNILFV